MRTGVRRRLTVRTPLGGGARAEEPRAPLRALSSAVGTRLGSVLEGGSRREGGRGGRFRPPRRGCDAACVNVSRFYSSQGRVGVRVRIFGRVWARACARTRAVPTLKRMDGVNRVSGRSSGKLVPLPRVFLLTVPTLFFSSIVILYLRFGAQVLQDNFVAELSTHYQNYILSMGGGRRPSGTRSVWSS